MDAVDGTKLRRTKPGLTRGELGCFYSHVGLWLRLTSGSEQAALVLEDDANVHLPVQWLDILAAARAAPQDCDVLFLGHNNQHGPPGIQRAQGDVFGCHAMIITRRGAHKLLEAYAAHEGYDPATRRWLPVDVWMSRQPEVRSYCVLPSMIHPFDLRDSETQRVR